MWIGHCLELDIVSTATDIKTLKKDMDDLISTQIEYAFVHDNLENLFRSAPREVWEEFWRD